MREGFIFYRSFYEAIKDLPRDVQGEVYTAIMEYSLNGITTENLKPIARSVFTLMKPQIDANNIKRNNGLKGGRPSLDNNQEVTEKEPNNNLNVTEPEPKEERRKKNVEGRKKKDNPPLPPLKKGGSLDLSFISDDLKELFQDWLSYKKEKKQTYKSQKSIKTCYNHLLRLSNNNSETAKNIVECSMANNWSGLFELPKNYKTASNANSSVCNSAAQEDKMPNFDDFLGDVKAYQMAMYEYKKRQNKQQ